VARTSSSVSPSPTMRPDLATGLLDGTSEHRQAARVAADGPHGPLQAATVSMLWFNTSGAVMISRGRRITLAVRDQDLDGGAGRRRRMASDRLGDRSRSRLAEVVGGHAR